MNEIQNVLAQLVDDFLNTVASDDPVHANFDHFPALKRLFQASELKFERRTCCRSQKRFAFLVIMGIVTAVMWLPLDPRDHSSREGCVWRTPDWLRDLLRVPVNCSICANLSSVDRLEGIEDNEAFMINYVETGKPVVITDAAREWSAQEAFSLEFFRSIYLNKTRANCQFFRYKSKFVSLQHVLETATAEKDDPWYVGWSNCDGEVAEILRAHYDRPYFLPDNSESAHTDWIFMGRPGYGANLHVDDVDYPSWQAQIKGSKKWLLYPPPECHYSCPRKFLEVILEAGDTLVVDTNWWYHKTLVVGNELSISIGSEFD